MVLLARRSMHAVGTRFGSDLKESAEAMQAKADCMRTVTFRKDVTPELPFRRLALTVAALVH